MTPGSADVPVGKKRPQADEDVGAPRDGASRDGASRGWYSRGYLPHLNAPQTIQSITYRLADSLPQENLKCLKDELVHLGDDQREAERRKRIEAWLDAGMGCCALANPVVARYVQNAFLHFHDERYHLHAWCIMPNHVHVLIEPLIDLATIVQAWKSFTARWIIQRNKELDLKIPSPDQFWMREYWDRYIRDSEHYRKAVDYIHQNPVQAGLCHTAEAWPWSSAFPGNADVLVGKKLTLPTGTSAPPGVFPSKDEIDV